MDMPASPFELLGGRDALARLVNRFYDLMDSDPSYAELRAMHAPDLSPMRESLTDFLMAWSGGPRDWFEQRPGACIVSLHARLPGVTQETARQWVGAMSRALDETAPGTEQLRASMIEMLTRMSYGIADNAARQGA